MNHNSPTEVERSAGQRKLSLEAIFKAGLNTEGTIDGGSWFILCDVLMFS